VTARRAERGAWVAGGVGLLGSAVVWMVSPAIFPHAWLAAVMFWLGWPLGSMALLFIHALTGGRWGRAIRPQLASGVATLPLLLPALLPLLFVLHALYPWMHADVAARLDNRFYLNTPFFYARSVVYLIIWLGLALLVLRALRQENPEPLMYRMAPPGLILLALSVTFAAIDFTLSLDPHFASSIYGMLVAGEAVLLALSIAVLGVSFVRRCDAAESTRDLGRLLFALLLLWAYLDFMQVLIVWNSDLPDEANWYLPRLVGGWAGVAIFIAALHFLRIDLASSAEFTDGVESAGGATRGDRSAARLVARDSGRGAPPIRAGCGADGGDPRTRDRNGAPRYPQCVAHSRSSRSWLARKNSSRPRATSTPISENDSFG